MYYDSTKGGGASVDMYYNPKSSQKVSCNASLESMKSSRSRRLSVKSVGGDASDILRGSSFDMSDCEAESLTKCLDIGAGAKIDQKVYADPNSLDFWQDKPAGFIYVNYCTVEKATALLSKRKDRTKGGEGFLAGLKTGN
jgi:hypothetical protein